LSTGPVPVKPGGSTVPFEEGDLPTTTEPDESSSVDNLLPPRTAVVVNNSPAANVGPGGGTVGTGQPIVPSGSENTDEPPGTDVDGNGE
jgi:hypothetical protein